MGIEWFRDLTIIIMGLSIILMGLAASVLLIFSAILIYRLYRVVNSTLLIVKATSKSAYDSVKLIQEALKPLLPMMVLFQGISGGFECISKMFKKESNQGGNVDEPG
jgi:hypothetical protein